MEALRTMRSRHLVNGILVIGLSLLALAAISCGDSTSNPSGAGTGTLEVSVVPEDSITSGIPAGPTDDDMQDGWSATYQKFLYAFGNVRASQSADPSNSVSDPTVYIVDLVATGANGFKTTTLKNLAAGQWDSFGYDNPVATSAAQMGDGLDAADYQFMITNGFALYTEGTITNPSGMSCPEGDQTKCKPATTVTFKWGLDVGTAYDQCGSEGATQLGFLAKANSTVSLEPTIHGDHWFFNAIPHGDESGIKRYGQWLADSDLDQDGETTVDEMMMIPASALFPSPKYDLTAMPLTATGSVTTAYDYFEAAGRSVGHLNGDGDCKLRSAL